MSTPPKARACALCGKPEAPAHTPFCSQGCRDRDLLNWLGEAYAIPGPPASPGQLAGVDSEADGPV